MAGEVVLIVEGMKNAAEAMGYLKANIDAQMARAMNKTGDRTRTRLAKMVREQVALSASYLSPSEGRLKVTDRASPSNLAMRITGRDRPTSLARFAGTGAVPKVRVKPGAIARRIPRSFFINLRSGNRGLAVRTDGEAPPGAYKPKDMGNGLWLLYGPSVDQVLMGIQARNGGAFGDVEPWAMDLLEAEFYRLLGVKELNA